MTLALTGNNRTSLPTFRLRRFAKSRIPRYAAPAVIIPDLKYNNQKKKKKKRSSDRCGHSLSLSFYIHVHVIGFANAYRSDFK